MGRSDVGSNDFGVLVYPGVKMRDRCCSLTVLRDIYTTFGDVRPPSGRNDDGMVWNDDE